ncbi:hypothetical protein, partial [Cognatiyoonia sp. IB215182]|uniref:hypothetical protein n=1 Tax=Cognatiyoonia sp. IB215182 TaxID=3097353 RepID=UPI002A1144D5
MEDLTDLIKNENITNKNNNLLAFRVEPSIIASSLHRFIASSLHRFIASSLHRFIASSLHRFIA